MHKSLPQWARTSYWRRDRGGWWPRLRRALLNAWAGLFLLWQRRSASVIWLGPLRTWVISDCRMNTGVNEYGHSTIVYGDLPNQNNLSCSLRMEGRREGRNKRNDREVSQFIDSNLSNLCTDRRSLGQFSIPVIKRSRESYRFSNDENKIMFGEIRG